MYGRLAGLGSKGEEEVEEGEEAGGAPPPTANLLSLRVRHCSLSHQSPTCSHTHTYTKMHTEGNLTRTLVHSKCEGLLLCQEASALPRTSLVPLVFSFFFSSLRSLSLSQVYALLLVSSVKDERKGGARGEARGRGREGPCVRMGEKLPCTMWSDLCTD